MPDVAAIETAVRAALARVVDPEIRKPITELDMLESVEAAGADAVTVRLAPADPGMCTMDYVPSVTEHELPDGVDGRHVTVDVVPAEEGAEPVSLELP